MRIRVFNTNDALKQRGETQAKMDALIIQAGSREFTKPEQEQFDSLKAKKQDLQARLDRHAKGLPQLDDVGLPPVMLFAPRNGNGGNGLGNGPGNEVAASLADWCRSPKMATDSPLRFGTSDGLSAAVITEVEQAVQTYYANDAFRLAGSTIYQTDNTVPLVKPIVSAGADADKKNEGESATDSKPMQVDSFTFHGDKYSRLVKVSEEALMNSALNLPFEIVAELGASIVTGFTDTITAGLLTALQGNSDCFVDSGLDHYDAMLSLTLAPPLRFQSPANKFMLSRADLKRIKNVRSTQNEPLFDATSGTILGYGVVLNDALDRVVFGSWVSGAYVRKSPLTLIRLNELYSANGYVGFKMTQYLDSKFLASVHTVESQPLFYTNIETPGS
jgi:HK97 family phage major capsid protein